jgi:hypothetical protein
MQAELQKGGSLLRMLHMRHILVLLFVLSLPLQWVWANSSTCQTETPASNANPGTRLHASNALPPTPVTLEAALSQAVFADTSTSELSHWELEMHSHFGITTQVYVHDVTGDMTADNLSCRPPANIITAAAAWPDPCEVDLPLPLSLTCLTLSDTLFVAPQHPPLPAPVFRAYRPPSVTA